MAATTSSTPIHILFVGAGAVGCFYASRCHNPAANINVSLVCRSNYSAIALSGVQLQTRNFGDYTFTPYATFPSISAAATDAEKAPTGGWDYVVVTTKALPDITDDSADIASLITPTKTCIVLIQNGVGVEAPHRARFPTNPIVSAVTIISAEQTSPGVVRQNRWTRISFGPFTDGFGTGSAALAQAGTACVAQLVDILTTHGQLRDAEVYNEIALQQVRWHKICINASMNPSAVLSGGIGNADMVTDPELRAHLRGCMDEVFAAAPAILGKPFPAKLATPDKILVSTERNKGGKPSMLLDWEAGRPMELEVILGNPVRIARQKGVEMPRLQSLYALLRSAQQQRDAQAKARKAAQRNQSTLAKL